MVTLNSLKRLHKPMSLLGVGGLAAVASVAMGVAQPAQAAATVSGQAIDSSSILPPTFTPPAAPFIGNADAGDTFEIDLSNVLAIPTDSNDFNLDNIFSLQFANLNTGNGFPTVNLSDLQLQVTGTFTGGGPFNTFTPIAIWDAAIGGQPTGGAFKGAQTSQGASNYLASGTQFGSTGAFNTLAISLTPSNTFGTFGNAGVINTSPINLVDAGVQTLTGLKITGKIAGFTGPGALSAGLAIYTGAPSSPPTFQVGNAPNRIYGNALTYGVPVPGPLPLFGAAAAFGWSRKLRRRVSATKIAA
jgi:hypothetical protein